MSPNRARELFIDLVAHVPEEQWDSRLAELAREDEPLRAKVAGLLAAHRQADSFLEQPAAPLEGTADAMPGLREPPDRGAPTEQIGTVLSERYKLLQEIGEGGMGTVWMAQQAEPVKRLVALKIIKAGMDSRQVIARFEAERQALALMDHPNIARVFDAGTTDTGRPYFVMELVKGVPLTKYCDEHRLTPKQRLELFIPICQAIQHAHQKGIIHRDLKPSNVLVASYDGKPVPKVIDFGIAKATGQQLTEKTLITGFGNIVGTLEYMSPEQAELNQLDIDTRSDIYSLGVLLYELLTGSTPLDKKRLHQAAMLEVLRIIREEEPPRPSTRLSTTEELPSVAANRGLEPKKLSGVVRGELDWIVMKALEKDRNRRYETANGFAMDVQRYLADEPVLACPPSAGYRLRKFGRRNRGRLAVAALVLFFLASLGGVAAWAAKDRADRAREAEAHQAARWATTERTVNVALDRAEQLAEQAQKMPGASSVEVKAALVVWQKAQDALAQADAALTTGADDDGLRQRVAELRAQLDKGQARAVRKEQLFRDLDEARLARSVWIDDHFDSAGCAAKYTAAFAAFGLEVTPQGNDELVRRIAAEEPEVREALLVALNDWVWSAKSATEGSEKDLVQLVKAADMNPWRKRYRDAVAKDDVPALYNLSVEARRTSLPSSSLSLLAGSLQRRGKEEEGLALLRWGRGRHRRDFWLHFDLGNQLRSRKGKTATPVELEEAIGCYRAALALRPETPAVHDNLGGALYDKGQPDEAMVEYREAIRIKKDFPEAHYNLGIALRKKGCLDEAIAAYRDAIGLKKDFPEAHTNLGNALSEKGQPDEAMVEYREAIRIKKHFPEAHYNLGNALRKKGCLDEAIAAYRDAIRIKNDYLEAHGNLGHALADKGRLDEAIAEYREVIRIKKDFPEAHYSLGNALGKKGCLDEAIAAYRDAIGLKKDYPEAHTNLGNALMKKGRLDEAIAEYREALATKQAFPETHIAHTNLGNLLRKKGRLDEAIVECRKAIALKPDYGEAHLHLGSALKAKGQLDEAIVEYRMAIRLKEDYPEAHTNLGSALKKKNRLDEAIAEYREALATKQPFPEAYIARTNLGNALRDKGLLDEAIAEYREAIRLKKDDPLAHHNLGDALRDKGLLDEAIAEYREAIELDPKNALAHYNLGIVLARKGRLDEAIAAYREAIRLNPDYAEAHCNLGTALRVKGQLDEAIAEFREAVRLKKDLPEAHYNLGNALYDKGRLDEAIAAFREAIRLKRTTLRLTVAWVAPSNRRASFARPWRRCAAVTNSVPGYRVGAILRPDGSGNANA
jgi:tetratricopeptide (TPR) repeat protein/serine/threonine protein kinase